MNPESKYILFYSKNCIHSRELLNQLYKNQGVYNKFIKIDVQNTTVKIPKCVSAVPTIIIRNPRMKPQVFTGDEVFNWYNHFLSRIENRKNAQKEKSQSDLGGGTNSSVGGVLDYDPCAMSGFSDNFSLLDDGLAKTNPFEHQFEFLGGRPSNAFVGRPNFGQQSNMNEEEDKGMLGKKMEELMAQRAMEVPDAPKREGGGAM